ncbi:DUF4186 domain-containing protein [Limobrevibacterium gyesilva]|uniref:DUF4186 domain-containing protein n=1 Tax=Limobrevibacterium gyesilva TaxID=2991712 RepID=A0AA41YPI3_9PROT|nr:DUF4186 domain-containing protein [Limobrevibacterium gyesilva]MCW3477719.1 DUF4186 domain-containing protein [Limobrevibacterium gyesilva]
MALARPLDDGKQTPFRGHPVFVAQHATATCRRAKWHDIPSDRPLSVDERERVMATLGPWFRAQCRGAGEVSAVELLCGRSGTFTASNIAWSRDGPHGEEAADEESSCWTDPPSCG